MESWSHLAALNVLSILKVINFDDVVLFAQFLCAKNALKYEAQQGVLNFIHGQNWTK